MFIDRVSSLDSGMKNKVNDFSADQVFDNSDITRKTDAAYSKDEGKLADNVAAEAAAAFWKMNTNNNTLKRRGGENKQSSF